MFKTFEQCLINSSDSQYTLGRFQITTAGKEGLK
jgi:hypothetical protein